MPLPARLRPAPLLCLFLVIGLGACGADPPIPSSSTEDGSEAQDAENVEDLAVGTDAFAFELPPVECPADSAGAGCPCNSNSDCQQNFCIETPDGKQCARTCTADCPAGYSCNTVSGPGGDTVSICVPRYGRICNPCAASSDCASIGLVGGACVDYGTVGQFCGAACQKNSDCAGGFACKAVKTTEGKDTKQCVGLADEGDGLGTCTCSALASQQGLETTCSVVVKGADGKVIGQCSGVRACGAAGLSACQAPDAKPEICDGLDNDCNGLTDEATCDDANSCTQDQCKASLATKEKDGCIHESLDKPCDADGSVCTQNDKCVGGVCKSGPLKSCDDDNPCTKDTCDPAEGCTQTTDDGVACSDGNLCTTGDVCKGGSCAKGKPIDCDVGKPCLVPDCDPETGGCKFTNKPEGLDCDDGQACTELDSCKGGACNGKVKNCDDGNPCTYEACDPTIGCKYVNSTAGCDDGSACTTGDTCKGGLCKANDVNCDDGNVCTQDSCEPKSGCIHQNAAIPCSDGDACSVGDLCKSATCVAGVKKTCDDKSTCSSDSCDATTGQCVFDGSAFEGAACNADDSVCTVGDKCGTGKCVPGKPKNCDDLNPCTDDDCDAQKGCQKVANTSGCDADNNACTVGDQCKNGDCFAGKDKNCDDANPCTADSCNAQTGVCEHAGPPQNGAPCDADGSVCSVADACKDGKCAAGKPKPCSDGNPCTDDGCEPKTGCTNAVNTDPCDDGAACTVGDACKDGKCLAGKPKVCDDKKVCTFDSCDAGTGACVYDAKALQSSACDADGSVCTDKDKCVDGVCALGAALPCDDGNTCTTDGCDAKLGCQPTNNTAACNDGNACTGADTCGAGKCAGSPVSCDDGNACTTDSCDKSTGCKHNPLAEGALCGPDKVCGGNVCKPAVCGDGVIQAAVEKCDGAQLAGGTCSSVLGAGSDGTLTCAAGCKAFDTTGCTVDLSWMDMSDDCKGFRQAAQYPTVHFAVTKDTTWVPTQSYQCPKGHHQASTAEGEKLFIGNAPAEFVYNGQCGWTGDAWNGKTRKYFRFSDSAATGKYKHVGGKEGDLPGVYGGTDFFAGIVCVQDK